MDPIYAAILGFIQGLTEWLPISSTGHLRIAENLIGLTIPLLFDVILHLGTLIVVLLFFRNDLKNLIIALKRWDFNSEDGKLIPLIIVGTLPTALIGLVFGSTVDSYFSSYLPIGSAFLVCGFVLFYSRVSNVKTDNITYFHALLIGTAQGIAIVPGISRSGFSISIALLLGIQRKKAFNFSFLVSIPTIVGALGLTFYEQYEALSFAGIEIIHLFVGIAVSIIVGFVSLRFLWKMVIEKKFYLFAFYCWLLGSILVILSISGF